MLWVKVDLMKKFIYKTEKNSSILIWLGSSISTIIINKKFVCLEIYRKTPQITDELYSLEHF